MSGGASALRAAIVLGAVALELRGGPAALAGAGLAPDLLLVAAVVLTGRPVRMLPVATALGLARDFIAGSPAGSFAVGFALAGLFAHAALGRERRPGILAVGSVVFLGGMIAYVVAALPTIAANREAARSLLEGAVRVALASAVLSPAVGVPLAAVDLLGGEPRPDLSRAAARAS